MMNSVYTTGLGAGFAVLWTLHILSVLLFSVGVAFLLYWAMKTLTLGQLKTWGIALTAIGAVLCLLTIAGKGSPWGYEGVKGARMMHMQMMDTDDDDTYDSSTGNGMGMSMNGMSMMLKGKTGDNFDETFIRMMIPHHQGAIDMAKLAQQNAKHPEIKTMANAIITTQQKEIDDMKQWLQEWGYND
jgi:hypothetical protein